MMTHLSLSLFLPLFVSFLVITSIKPCILLFSCYVALSPIYSSSLSPFTSPHSLQKRRSKRLRWCYWQREWRRCKFWNVCIYRSRLWSIYENKRIRYRTGQGQHSNMNVDVVLFLLSTNRKEERIWNLTLLSQICNHEV